MKDLNMKCKITKFLEDTIGENLDDTGYGEAFFRYNTKDNNP